MKQGMKERASQVSTVDSGSNGKDSNQAASDLILDVKGICGSRVDMVCRIVSHYNHVMAGNAVISPPVANSATNTGTHDATHIKHCQQHTWLQLQQLAFLVSLLALQLSEFASFAA